VVHSINFVSARTIKRHHHHFFFTVVMCKGESDKGGLGRGLKAELRV
jgi:hypothetical protein